MTKSKEFHLILLKKYKEESQAINTIDAYIFLKIAYYNLSKTILIFFF